MAEGWSEEMVIARVDTETCLTAPHAAGCACIAIVRTVSTTAARLSEETKVFKKGRRAVHPDGWPGYPRLFSSGDTYR